MEIKRPVSNVPAELQEINFGQTEEKAVSEKPAGVASVADSVEAAKSKTEQSFSEIYQSGQQTGDTTSQKELGADEQQLASNFSPDDLKEPSFFVQDSRSRYEEGKNSGLTAPFSQATGSTDSQFADKIKRLTQEEIFNLNTGANSSEQTNDAVNDILQGGNLRDAVNEKLAERHEEINNLTGGAGSPKDLQTNVIGSAGTGKSGPTYGKNMLMDALSDAVAEANKQYPLAGGSKNPENKHPGVPSLVGEGQIGNYVDWVTNGKKGPDPRAEAWYMTPNGEMVPASELTEGQKLAAEVKKDQKTEGQSTDTTIVNPTGKSPDKSLWDILVDFFTDVDPENYDGDIPPEIKNQFDYLSQQYAKAHQSPGGEEIQEDPNAIGGSKIADGRLHVAELGITGLVGQPSQDVDQHSGPGGSTQPGGASGGDIDWEDRTGFSGTTHQDGPGDVQFGPDAPLEQAAETEEEEESSNSKLSGNILDQFSQKKTE